MKPSSSRPDPATADLPHYSFPLSFARHFLPPFFLGRRASFARHGEWLLRRVGRPAVVQGAEKIPAEGPFVVVVNHYQRKGRWVAWNAYLISSVVARHRPGTEVHWVMNEGFGERAQGALPWPMWFLRWLFRRVARMYGHVPVPPDITLKAGRARAVREMIEVVSPRAPGRAGEPLGIFPEGRNNPGGLGRPPVGVGWLVRELGGRGVPFIPVGVYEEEGVPRLTFGDAVTVEQQSGAPGDDVEDAVRSLMVAVGRLLPREMWGVYAADIEASLAGEPR
jgi:1-acyl-sn-glycerol-3-phosphate acyltransferase